MTNMGNTFFVDDIEYKIVRNPHTNGPMISRTDGVLIENRKEVCRRFLLKHGWTYEMFGRRITNDLERQINKIVNNGHVPNEIDDSEKPIKPSKPAKAKNKVNKDLKAITNENLEKVHQLVLQDPKYGKENNLITIAFKAHPGNTDVATVAMKVALIDITNSTHISQHKSKVSLVDLAEIIVAIPNIDERIANGDPTVVNEIAKTNGEINLFSFASKYCCYHNHNLYGKDDYSILDTVLKETLPLYFEDVKKSEIQKWQNKFDYKSYNDFIAKKLDELNITIPNRRRKFDHFVWYLNR